MNLRVGEQLEFSNEESIKEWANQILENTENEEGLSLMLFANTSQ